MGKSTINGPFSLAMLNYQRVSHYITHECKWRDAPLCQFSTRTWLFRKQLIARHYRFLDLRSHFFSMKNHRSIGSSPGFPIHPIHITKVVHRCFGCPSRHWVKAKICRKPRFHQPTMKNFPCTSRLNCLFRPSSEASPAINRERLVCRRKGFPCRWVVWSIQPVMFQP